MNIIKLKIFSVLTFSFVWALLYSLLNLERFWISFLFQFLIMTIIQTILFYFFIVYRRLKVKDIKLEEEKVVFVTGKKEYIFNIIDCSKIIENKKKYIFEFKKMKIGLILYSENKIDIEYNNFPNAKYINKN